MYRLTVNIGVAFTSASYEMGAGSEVLRLSPYTVDLPSARFLTDEGLRIDWLAETLRSIVETARQQLGVEPASVQVIYPASWLSGQLLQLWEALVLAGIPDAMTQVDAEPRPSASPPSVDDQQSPAKTILLPAKAARMVRPRWLVAAAVAAVGAGVVAGILVTGAQRPGPIPGDADVPDGDSGTDENTGTVSRAGC
jgi:hypothetical protein